MRTKGLLYLFVLSIMLVGTSCQHQRVYRIGVCQCSTDDWRAKMNAEIYREVMLHPDVSVEIRSAGDSNAKQIADIKYFADNHFDIIIVAPNEAKAITPVVTEIYHKGIPIIIFDRNIEGNTYTAYQGVDNVDLGRLAANYARHLLPHPKVLEIYGLSGSTPAQGRHEGFVNTLPVCATVYGDWNQEDAERVTDSMFNLYPDINLIYAHNDRMAIGASLVARKRGNDVKVIGIDAAPQIGIQAVADSIIDATFLYPTEGHRLIRTALHILKGESYDTTIILPTASAVDRTNADILLLQDASLQEETNKLSRLKKQTDDYLIQVNLQKTLLYALCCIMVLVIAVLVLLLWFYKKQRRHKRITLERNKLLFESTITNEFYQRFRTLIEKQMSDENLSIDLLAQQMTLSRTQLYRKLKQVTDEQPGEIIKSIRLQHAQQLLLTTDKSIGEIAYQIGFSSPAYFTKCYRERYGELPSHKREKISQQ